MAAEGLSAFAIVFAVIGGTELVDRTNFALIGLATKHRPAVLWAGATAAFVLTTAIAVLVGAAFLAVVGPQVFYLRLGGGIFLLGYATYLLLVPEAQRPAPSSTSAFRSGFLTIMLLELGDTTMILVVLFVGTVAQAWVVGAAAALALALVAASACFFGSRLAGWIKPDRLERYVVVVLYIVAAVTIVYAFWPGVFPSLLG